MKCSQRWALRVPALRLSVGTSRRSTCTKDLRLLAFSRCSCTASPVTDSTAANRGNSEALHGSNVSTELVFTVHNFRAEILWRIIVHCLKFKSLRKEKWLHYERFQCKEESVFAGNCFKLMQHPQPLGQGTTMVVIWSYTQVWWHMTQVKGWRVS